LGAVPNSNYRNFQILLNYTILNTIYRFTRITISYLYTFKLNNCFSPLFKNDLFKLNLFFIKFTGFFLTPNNRSRWVSLDSVSLSSNKKLLNFKSKSANQESFFKRQVVYENFVDYKKHFLHTILTNRQFFKYIFFFKNFKSNLKHKVVNTNKFVLSNA
jgi:hypothetical protein